MRLDKPVIKPAVFVTASVVFFIIINLFLLNYLYSKQREEQEKIYIEMIINNGISIIDYWVSYRTMMLESVYREYKKNKLYDYTSLKDLDINILDAFVYKPNSSRNKYSEYIDKIIAQKNIFSGKKESVSSFYKTKDDENIMIIAKDIDGNEAFVMVFNFNVILWFFDNFAIQKYGDFSYLIDLDTNKVITSKKNSADIIKSIEDNAGQIIKTNSKNDVSIFKYNNITTYNKNVSDKINLMYGYVVPKRISSQNNFFNLYFIVAVLINICLIIIAIVAYINFKMAQKESYIDNLTGVYNRRYFHNTMKRFLKKKRFPLSIIVLDMNYLKIVNDTEGYGHNKGDESLRKIASTLTTVFRADDIVARIGGDEFAVVLPSTTEKSVAKLIERINIHLSELNERFPNEFPISVAMGYITVKDGKMTEEEIYAEADKAMYKNKRDSRNSSSIEIEKWKKRSNIN